MNKITIFILAMFMVAACGDSSDHIDTDTRDSEPTNITDDGSAISNDRSDQHNGGGDETDHREPSVKTFPHGYPDKKPASIEHALDILDIVIESNDKDVMRRMEAEDLIQFHFGLGMWIRNNFGLWSGNDDLMNELGGGHPDGASMRLIEAYWSRLNRDNAEPNKARNRTP